MSRSSDTPRILPFRQKNRLGSHTGRPVAVIYALDSAAARSLAEECQSLHGGEVLEIPPLEWGEPREGECESCQGFGQIRDLLLARHRSENLPPNAPLWVVPDPKLDPWEWLGILSWEFYEETGLFLSSAITVIDAGNFWVNWTQDEPSDFLDPDSPSVAHRLCGQIEFAEDWVLTPSPEDPALSAFLRRLNPGATLHVPATHPHALQILGLRVKSRSPGDALELPRAAWRSPLMPSDIPQKAPPDPKSVSLFQSRRPFHPERLQKLLAEWPEAILRTEGTLWVASHPTTAFHMSQVGPNSFELAGEGEWLALLPPGEIRALRQEHPELFETWDPQHGDRQNELVFVWEDEEHPEFHAALARCVLGDFELRRDWTRPETPSP
jgi:G3E family GTPase